MLGLTVSVSQGSSMGFVGCLQGFVLQLKYLCSSLKRVLSLIRSIGFSYKTRGVSMQVTCTCVQGNSVHNYMFASAAAKAMRGPSATSHPDHEASQLFLRIMWEFPKMGDPDIVR